VSTTDLAWWRRVSEAVSAAGRAEGSPADALRTLQEGLGVDTALLSVVDARRPGRHRVVANVDYPAEVVDYMSTVYVRECPGYRFAEKSKIAARICDTPFDFRETRTYTEALGPAGFREGVTVAFTSPWSGHTGFLAMSSSSPAPIPEEARLGLTLLAPSFAGLASPTTPPKEELGAQQAMVEIDVLGGVRWLRREHGSAGPVTESQLREFARYLRVGRRARAGYYARGEDGNWWHVQGYVRAVSNPGVQVVVMISPETPRGALTPRELDILGLVCRGMTNGQIAAELYISLGTVKTHVEALLRKLEQQNRSGLVAIAAAEDLFSAKYLM
jgi:DNA-binding CsgD family transcriptional regulator